MTKVKLKDATRDLLKSAESVLANVNAIRKTASKLNESALAREAAFQKEEEEKRSLEKKAEQERLISQHTKAFTMPDNDETETVSEETSSEPKNVQTTPTEELNKIKTEEPKLDVNSLEDNSAVKAVIAEEVSHVGTTVKEKETAPRAKKSDPVLAASHEEGKKTKSASAQDKPKVSKKQKEEENHEPAAFARPRVDPPKEEPKPAETNPAEKKQPQPAEKANPAPVQRSAQAAAPSTKPQTQQQSPRPTNTQNTNARPAQLRTDGPRQQGSYGRPANPQGQQGPYGRPVNPQGQQGPYGRPVNPQGQQGPYGRPANPQGQQGPYGRPANPQGQQGPYGRPANPQGQQGGFGRPANSQNQQGGFGRPAANAQGGQRTGGFQNRSQGSASRSKQPVLEMTPTVEKERVSNYDPNKKNYDRPHDPEHVTRNRKQLARDNFANMDDDVVRGGRKARSKKQPSAQQMMAPIKIENAVMTAETITVRDLTERIGKPAGEILKQLLMLGIMATINSELDYDTASLVCSELGVDLELNIKKNAEDKLAEISSDVEEEDNLLPRPPVVTIMGHVDHGKTTLLDHIRNAHVTAGEAGGITQHIGAYTVDLHGRVITFLDTPGHEAFTAMRARGAQATDIAVLVVAADDGVMPQTVEAINHAKAANVPIIVAINKMDKPTANPDRVKQDLTSYELICEDWGGETIMVPVSAMTGEGVDNLLEMILLQADMLELRANPNRMARGVIIEAKLDKARGPMATVLLQNGTLHVGDNIVAGMSSGRVRAMMNDRGERVESAGPSMPVEITGFAEVPSAGDDMMAVDDDHLGRQVVQERRDKLKAARVAASTKVSLDNLFSRIDQSKQTTLNVIIKADVQGSVEAVKAALEKLSNDEVKVRVLYAAVGAITRDDVNLASASDAVIIGFNIRPDASASESAKHEGVDIRLYRVIYQAIEDIEKAMKGLLDPEYREVLLGHAEVRNTFRITGAGTVAGCYVKDGKMQRNAECRLLRDNVVVHEGKLNSLKRFKDDVKEVAEGYECGISFDGYNDIKENDVIECFIMEEIER